MYNFFCIIFKKRKELHTENHMPIFSVSAVVNLVKLIKNRKIDGIIGIIP